MEYNGDDTKKRKLNGEEQGGGEMSEEELKSYLEPLSKDQLVALLATAGCQYPAIAEEIRDVASKDPAHRKLFVRGLAWETTSQALLDVFIQYGEIEEGAVIVDKVTGKSKGFGFITFKHMDSSQKALKEPSKMIDGRITVSNLASLGTTSASASTDISQRKIYIGGLSYDTSNETLINRFSQYGEIEEGSVAYDKNTNKSRGFAFVTFKTAEAAKKSIEDSNKNIDGRQVIVKLALEGQKEKGGPQSVMNSTQAMPAGYVGNRAPQVPRGGTPSVVGYAGYPAYTSQPGYAVLPGAQYGVVGASQYGQYAAGLYPSAATPTGTMPPYYTGMS